jgi:hypothetical protein
MSDPDGCIAFLFVFSEGTGRGTGGNEQELDTTLAPKRTSVEI